VPVLQYDSGLSAEVSFRNEQRPLFSLNLIPNPRVFSVCYTFKKEFEDALE